MDERLRMQTKSQPVSDEECQMKSSITSSWVSSQEEFVGIFYLSFKRSKCSGGSQPFLDKSVKGCDGSNVRR